MNNYDKYKKQIDVIWKNGSTIALIGGKPTDCKTMACDKCDWYCSDCCEIPMAKWLVAEYKEPPIDWNKVEIDTPILVRDSDDEEWRKRHFAGYENGKVYTWDNGCTSWTASSQTNIASWECAKLAEVQNE